MTRSIIWMILSLGLFSCVKKNDPVPINPIVGTWSMHRIVYSDFPSYYNHNRVDSNATRIGTITYVFKSDSTYAQAYAGYNSFYPANIPLGIVEGTELGVWQPISPTVDASFGFTIKPKTRSPFVGIGYTQSITVTPGKELKIQYSKPLPVGIGTSWWSETIYYKKKTN